MDARGVRTARPGLRQPQGPRPNEMIRALRELWKGGWISFRGEYYDIPEMTIEPHPPSPVPILCRRHGVAVGQLGGHPLGRPRSPPRHRRAVPRADRGLRREDHREAHVSATGNSNPRTRKPSPTGSMRVWSVCPKGSNLACQADVTVRSAVFRLYSITKAVTVPSPSAVRLEAASLHRRAEERVRLRLPAPCTRAGAVNLCRQLVVPDHDVVVVGAPSGVATLSRRHWARISICSLDQGRSCTHTPLVRGSHVTPLAE